jgi:hypothetical protein
MGWLISVEARGAIFRWLYATVAYTHEQTRLQVFKQVPLTNEAIRLERILTEGEIKILGLQPGEVKLFFT